MYLNNNILDEYMYLKKEGVNMIRKKSVRFFLPIFLIFINFQIDSFDLFQLLKKVGLQINIPDFAMSNKLRNKKAMT